MAFHLLKRFGSSHRAKVTIALDHPIANAHFFGFGTDFFNQFIVDGGMGIHPIDAAARLPHVAKTFVGNDLGGVVEISVGTYDGRAMPAQFQGYFFQLTGYGCHDFFACMS